MLLYKSLCRQENCFIDFNIQYNVGCDRDKGIGRHHHNWGLILSCRYCESEMADTVFSSPLVDALSLLSFLFFFYSASHPASCPPKKTKNELARTPFWSGQQNYCAGPFARLPRPLLCFNKPNFHSCTATL